MNTQREAEGINIDRGPQPTLNTKTLRLNVIITHSKFISSPFTSLLCPPPKGRGTYCFWCGSCWRQRDTFLFAQYLMNRRVDLNYICMDVTLGHDEELVRFW